MLPAVAGIEKNTNKKLLYRQSELFVDKGTNPQCDSRLHESVVFSDYKTREKTTHATG